MFYHTLQLKFCTIPVPLVSMHPGDTCTMDDTIPLTIIKLYVIFDLCTEATGMGSVFNIFI